MDIILVLLIALGAFAVVMLLFWGIAYAVEGRDQTINQRMDTFVAREYYTEAVGEVSERNPSVISQKLDEAVKGKEFATNIRTNLARADIKMNVGEYMLIVLLCMISSGLAFWIIMHQSLVVSFFGLVLGFFLPQFYVSARQKKRLGAFNSQLSDGINLMANGLRSGYSLLQAMESLSKEMPAPISDEFRRVIREVGLGVSYEKAMNNLLRRMPSDDLDLMITAINVQAELGGNLAELLENISFTIRERVRLKGEIETLTSQQMLSGYIISFLPIGLGFVLYAMNGAYMGRMFTQNSTQPCGWVMAGIACLIVVLGFLAIKKIVNIEV
jgi:tight adherence protein B